MKAANLNKRALTIREERAQIGQVAFIKIVLPLCRCQNPTTYARLFEEEWCTYNLSLKWRTLSKWKDYCFKLKSTAKTGNFSMETIFERDLRKFYTVSRKHTHCKCKIQLLFNKIRFRFEHLFTRTTIVLSLKTAGWGCIRKWRFRSTQAIVSSAAVNNNGSQD